MHLLGRQRQRQQCHPDQADIAHQAGQADFGAQDVEGHRAFPHAAQQHQADHGTQQGKVQLAVKAQGLARRLRRLRHGTVATCHPAVQHKEHRQQHADQEQGLGPDVQQGPAEVHALQKAQEQRRIAQGRQRAARIRDDEDEEHHDVHHLAAVGIGADQRANQQHGGASCAHEAGQHRAQRQDGRVQHRRARQAAADVDATGHHVQRRQQDHERQVLRQQRVRKADCRRPHPVREHQGHQECQGPRGGDLAEMVVPDAGQQQGHQGNRQQQARKGHGPPQGQAGALQFGRLGQGGQGRHTACHEGSARIFHSLVSSGISNTWRR